MELFQKEPRVQFSGSLTDAKESDQHEHSQRSPTTTGRATRSLLTGVTKESMELFQKEPRVQFSGSLTDARESDQHEHSQPSRDFSEEPSTAADGREEEEDWETVLGGLPTAQKTSFSIVCKESLSDKRSAIKQRGRGSFTHGQMGMYSDTVELTVDENDGVDSDDIEGSPMDMSDLAPSIARPASSSRVAQRMIAKALSGQQTSKALLSRSQGSVQEIQKQEKERKLRLQARAQLRDDAWGADDD